MTYGHVEIKIKVKLRSYNKTTHYNKAVQHKEVNISNQKLITKTLITTAVL